MARPTDVPGGEGSRGARPAVGRAAAEPTGASIVVADADEHRRAPDEDADDRTHRRPTADDGGRSGWLRDARVAWAVAAFMTIVAVVSFVTGLGPRQAAAAERAALEAAEVAAARITTFEGATIDEWVQSMQQASTDEFASTVARRFDQELRTTLRDVQARSVGEVIDSFIQSLEGETALAFVIVRQTNTSIERVEPVEDELRMQIELRRIDGEWLANNIQILGPASLAPGAQVAPGAGVEQTAPPAGPPAAPSEEPAG